MHLRDFYLLHQDHVYKHEAVSKVATGHTNSEVSGFILSYLRPKMATQTKKLYLAGVGVSHSVAKPMHNAIAKGLNLPWEFELLDCPTVEYMIDVFRQPDFAGGVVTMPYKKEIMSHLDDVDTLAVELGACNNVYLDSEGKLRGTNTDWRGIKGSLLGVSDEGRGKPALIVGAGGAARAAVYALYKHLDCTTIYVINRDSQEVVDLCKDAEVYQASDEAALNIVHVTSTEQAAGLPAVYYIVGTVQDSIHGLVSTDE